jgi:hypothetical protein
MLKASPQPAVYIVGYSTDGYLIQKVNPNSPLLVSVSVPGTYRDASLEVDARIQEATANRFVALTCREQQASGSGSRFILQATTGQVSIARLDGGTTTTLSGPTAAPSLRGASETNRIGLVCVGQRIVGRVNNVDVISVEDATHREGSLLIGAGADSGGPLTVEARFRDLVVASVR